MTLLRSDGRQRFVHRTLESTLLVRPAGHQGRWCPASMPVALAVSDPWRPVLHPGVARTAGFTTLVLAQLFNAFNSRSETSSAFLGTCSPTAGCGRRWPWACCFRSRGAHAVPAGGLWHGVAGRGALGRGDRHGVGGAVVRRGTRAGRANDRPINGQRWGAMGEPRTRQVSGRRGVGGGAVSMALAPSRPGSGPGESRFSVLSIRRTIPRLGRDLDDVR